MDVSDPPAFFPSLTVQAGVAGERMQSTKLLLKEVGGPERLAQLKAAYKKAKPRRGRWGPCILTADEIFRQQAKQDGFSDEGIAMFIEYVEG